MTASKAAGNVAKLRDIVDISDPVYGAALDGVTDDRAALLAAVATGKIVSLGGKTLAIGSQVACAADGRRIVWPRSDRQLTAMHGDATRVAGVSSERLNISFNKITNLTVGATFLAGFGYQTDGINISYQGSKGHAIHGNVIDTVGEGIDCYGSFCTIEGN